MSREKVTSLHEDRDSHFSIFQAFDDLLSRLYRSFNHVAFPFEHTQGAYKMDDSSGLRHNRSSCHEGTQTACQGEPLFQCPLSFHELRHRLASPDDLRLCFLQ